MQTDGGLLGVRSKELVQVLDARANEVFGCSPTKKIFLRYQFMSLFLVISQNLTKIFLLFPQITSRKFWRPFFNHFFQFLFFLSLFFLNIFPDAPLSWMPGPFFTFSSLFTHLPLLFDIYLCIFSENSVVGCPPRLEARGRRTPRHPLCTTLPHVNSLCWTGGKNQRPILQRCLLMKDLIPEIREFSE